MSVRDCLDTLVDAGELSAENRREVLELLEELAARHGASLQQDLLDPVMGNEAVRILKDQAARKKRLAALRILAARRIGAQMQRHDKGLRTGATSHLVRDVYDAAPWDNVDARHNQILGTAHSLWRKGIEALRPKGFGLSRVMGGQKTTERNVLRELFGEDSGDDLAKTVANAWKESAEYVRARFNAAGGAIAKRADWGLPQSHDMKRVAEVSRDEWVEFVTPLLDRDKMRDFVTDAPLADGRLRTLLDQTYERIRTDGLSDLAPAKTGRRMLANRHQDHRFLSFKDADAWLTYQRRFGEAAIFPVMTRHLDVMAKDIALMEILGPNPDAMVRHMGDLVRRDAALRGQAPPSMDQFEHIYANLTRRAQAAEREGVASFFSGTRNMLTAAQLGGAFISAITDLNFGRLARRFNGLPQMRVVDQYLRFLNPRNTVDQQFAVQLGLVAENWTTQALAQKRYLGEVEGPEITRWFADTVLKASLLSPWTQAGRWAFGVEFSGLLGRLRGQAFNELPLPLRRSFRRYGINDADWNAYRQIGLVEHKGAPFLSPVEASLRGAPETSAKFHRMIQTETEFAVPTVDTRTRALLNQGQRPGTFMGEIARSIAMYKSFPVTIINTHLMRGLNQNGTRKGLYLADLFISSTVFGMLAYQLKQVQRGRDPISTDPNTEEGRRVWLAGMMQGGGLGIFGDFLFSDANRFGSGPAMTFAGPMARLVDDLAALSVGNAQELYTGEDTNAAREIIRFARSYTPGGSIWYARLAFERMILDQLQLKTDPRARRSFRSIEQRARQDFDQRYFWRPGQTSPRRGPDLGALTNG